MYVELLPLHLLSNNLWITRLILFVTSHASIAYRKQLPPQRTVGTIGSVWQESTPSKETTGPAQTRKAKGYESEQSEMPNGARAAFAWARGL